MAPHLIKWYPLHCNCLYKRKKIIIFSNSFHSLMISNYLLITLTNHIVSTFKRCHKFCHSLQPTPLFLLKKNPSHEQRTLAGYWHGVHGVTRNWTWLSDWTHTHKHTHTHTHTNFVPNLLRGFFFSTHERILDFYEQHKGDAKKKIPFVIASKRIK